MLSIYAEKKELEKLVGKLNFAVRKYKEAKESYEREKNELQERIIKKMNLLDVQKYTFVSSDNSSDYFANIPNASFTCSIIEPKKILYDAKKINDVIDSKELKNKVIDKKYHVNNMEGLIELLKEHGVKPKEFKKFIDVEMSVNEKELNQLYSLGFISLDDIEGCYEADVKNPYLSIRVKTL